MACVQTWNISPVCEHWEHWASEEKAAKSLFLIERGEACIVSREPLKKCSLQVLVLQVLLTFLVLVTLKAVAAAVRATGSVSPSR